MSRPITRTRDVPADALAYTVDEAAERLAIGKTLFEDLISSGEIKTFKIGRRRLVSRTALEKYVAKKDREA